MGGGVGRCVTDSAGDSPREGSGSVIFLDRPRTWVNWWCYFCSLCDPRWIDCVIFGATVKLGELMVLFLERPRSWVNWWCFFFFFSGVTPNLGELMVFFQDGGFESSARRTFNCFLCLVCRRIFHIFILISKWLQMSVNLAILFSCSHFSVTQS